MKKTAKNVIIFVIVSILAVSTSLLVSATEETRCESVYASAAEQTRLYELLMEDAQCNKILDYYGIRVVKESITPVFTIDMERYGETGEFALESVRRLANAETLPEYGNVYVAKTVTATGEYGGTLRFYEENGSAFYWKLTPSAVTVEESVAGAYTVASCYYTDHAERIGRILGTDEPIPAASVRYVEIPYKGNAFYVQTDDDEVIIYVGFEQISSDTAVEVRGELLEQAREYYQQQLEQRRQYEEWQKEHPGEDWSYTGGAGIAADISASKAVETAEQHNRYIVLIAIAVCLLIAFIAVFLFQKRQAKKDR